MQLKFFEQSISVVYICLVLDDQSSIVLYTVLDLLCRIEFDEREVMISLVVLSMYGQMKCGINWKVCY